MSSDLTQNSVTILWVKAHVNPSTVLEIQATSEVLIQGSQYQLLISTERLRQTEDLGNQLAKTIHIWSTLTIGSQNTSYKLM